MGQPDVQPGAIRPGELLEPEADEPSDDQLADAEQQEPTKYFDDDIKEKLALYRQKKRIDMLQN